MKKTQSPTPLPLDVEGQHTPGEWEIVTDLAAQLFPNEIFIAVKNDRGIFQHPICDVFLANNKNGKANACLIAKAPTLLKENEQLKEQVRVLREALNEQLKFANGDCPPYIMQRSLETLSQTETK